MYQVLGTTVASEPSYAQTGLPAGCGLADLWVAVFVTPTFVRLVTQLPREWQGAPTGEGLWPLVRQEALDGLKQEWFGIWRGDERWEVLEWPEDLGERPPRPTERRVSRT